MAPKCLDKATVKEFVVGRILCFRCGPCAFLFWTLFWMLWHLIWFLLDVLMLTENKPEKYFRYLTNWGYLLLVVTSLVDFLTVVFTMLCCKSTVDENEQHTSVNHDKAVPKFIFPTWICFETAKCIALTISIGYYLFLAIDGNIIDQSATSLSSIVFHFVNSVYIILNLIVSTKPVGCCHFLFSMAFAIVYIGLSAILNVACGIKPPYENVSFLKFNKETSFFVVWSILAPIGIHGLIYKVKKRCVINKVQSHQPSLQANVEYEGSQNDVWYDQQTIHQEYYSTVNGQFVIQQNVWHTPSNTGIIMNSYNGGTIVYTT